MSRDGEGRSRRDVLRTAAGISATGLLTGLAGCSAVADNLPMVGENHLEYVPEDAKSVTYADVNAVLDDESVKRLSNVYIDEASKSEYYSGPEDYGEARESFEDETDLPPAEVNYQVSFSEYSEYGLAGQYYATIVDSDWAEDDVVDAYEENYGDQYEDEDYGEGTIYVPSNEWSPHVGVVTDGTYAHGRRTAIEDVIDVERGEEDAIEDPVRSGYEGTRDAPVRFAGEMPPWIEGDTSGPGGQEFSLEPFQNTEYVAGSVYESGSKRGAETTILAGDEDTAIDIEDVVSGYISVVSASEYTSKELETVLEDSTVERNGRKVVVGYEAEVDELESLLEDAMGGS